MIHWTKMTDEQFAVSLEANLDTPCTQCPHTKLEHFSAGPVCAKSDCDCLAFIADPKQ